MKFQKLAFALPFLISQSVFAVSPDQPDACPQPEAFAAVGVNEVEFDELSSMWAAYRTSSSFETAHQWTLIVAPIDAENASDALNQANKALPGLTLNYGPEGEDGMWACLYSNANESLMAIAVTPPVLGDVKRLINKFNLKAIH
ncbi:hemin binding protein Hbp [Legionella beliardensis]|uniref:Hemin binding protein Hbp n=1 Tax=Legionella beliardensis TaxID=91822 RepID=A0A378I473_9GAMM|nr:DUF4949 domain-containing protein [Legionella beliardensis]STX29979.1 hemin binding protein Hbp [Legionella beliardensis]